MDEATKVHHLMDSMKTKEYRLDSICGQITANSILQHDIKRFVIRTS